MGHGGCFQVFNIWNSRLLGNLLCNLPFFILGLTPSITLSIGLELPFDVALLVILVTIHLWYSIWYYTITISISAVSYFKNNLLQSLNDWPINLQSVLNFGENYGIKTYPWQQRAPTTLSLQVTIFTHSILNIVLVGDDTNRFYCIQVIHTTFLDKPCKLLVLMNLPNNKCIIRRILKYVNYISNLLGLKIFGNIK